MKYLLFTLLMLFGVAHAQITLNSDIVEATQRSVDGKQYKLVSGKHVPYTSASEYLSIIPSTRRHVGQIAYVGNQVYHFVNNIADSSFKLFADTVGVVNSFSQTVTDEDTFTVIFARAQPNNTYIVNITPTSAISAASRYVTNKTTTSFDVVYLAAITGTVTFDWTLINDQ